MKKTIAVSLIASFLIAGCSTLNTNQPSKTIKYSRGNVVKPGEVFYPKWLQNEAEINSLLTHNHYCSDHLILRYQEMSTQQINQACNLLRDTDRFIHGGI